MAAWQAGELGWEREDETWNRRGRGPSAWGGGGPCASGAGVGAAAGASRAWERRPRERRPAQWRHRAD
jgi:hypothetical protein